MKPENVSNVTNPANSVNSGLVAAFLNVKVKKRVGVTSSIISHTNGTYPVWFDKCSVVAFIEKDKVIFI
jgi:hypothetical protein